jgi:nucleoside-diphosphate-sugar epimerase
MILVTGATGLVGSYLLHDLAIRGHEVQALKRKNSNIDFTTAVFSFYGHNDLLHTNINWVDGDILDIFSLEEAMDGIDDVYHCAAIVSFDPGNKHRIIQNNVDGTANVVNAALSKHIHKLCHVSSISSLGPASADGLITEDSVWQPSRWRSAYSLSKVESEREVWRGMAEGLKAVIVNPSVIIGAGGATSESGSLMKTISHHSAFYTGGVNGFVGIRDVTKAMIMLMHSNIQNERFILSAYNLTYRELITLIAEQSGKEKPWIKIPAALLMLAWLFGKPIDLIANSKPIITRSVIDSILSKRYYSGEKIKNYIPFKYTPAEEAVREACQMFRHVENKNSDSPYRLL